MAKILGRDHDGLDRGWQAALGVVAPRPGAQGEPAHWARMLLGGLWIGHRGVSGGRWHRSQGAPYRPLLSKAAKPMDIRVSVLLSKLSAYSPTKRRKKPPAKRSRNGASDPPKWDYLLSARGIGGSDAGDRGEPLPARGRRSRPSAAMAHLLRLTRGRALVARCDHRRGVPDRRRTRKSARRHVEHKTSRSGRIEARIGLRMMPTFPRSIIETTGVSVIKPEHSPPHYRKSHHYGLR